MRQPLAGGRGLVDAAGSGGMGEAPGDGIDAEEACLWPPCARFGSSREGPWQQSGKPDSAAGGMDGVVRGA